MCTYTLKKADYMQCIHYMPEFGLVSKLCKKQT